MVMASPTPAQCRRLTALLRERVRDGSKVATILDEMAKLRPTIFGVKLQPLGSAQPLYDAVRDTTKTLSPKTAMWVAEWLAKFGKMPGMAKLLNQWETEQSEQLVTSFREFFGHGGDVDIERVKPFHGTYRFFRPLHLHPRTHYTVGLIRIGLEGRGFDCSLLHSFTDHMGQPITHRFTGKIIPHERRATLLMKASSRAKFYIYLDRVDRPFRDEHDQLDVTAFTGVMLAAAGSDDLASCWPIYAYRDDELTEKDIRPTNHLIADLLDEPASKPVVNAFSRGAVLWDPVDFERPPRPHGGRVSHVTMETRHPPRGLKGGRTRTTARIVYED